MSYRIPPDADERPVLVVGAGTLGARIALMFASGGSPVRIVNRSPERAEEAKRFVEAEAGLDVEVEVFADLETAVPGAWLIIESIAENAPLKREILARVDRLADADAIVATNSSSFPSSLLIDDVEHPERVLNIHFLMPPQ